VTDDPARATVTIVESYRLPGFWRAETRWFNARIIEGSLPAPGISQRSMPLAVRHPTFVTHETRVTMPGLDPIETGPLDLSDDAMSLHCDRALVDRSLSIRCRYRTLRDFVPAASVEDHLRLADRMRQALSYGTTLRAPGSDDGDPWTWKLTLCVIGACVGAIGLLFGFPRLLRIRSILRKRASTRKLAMVAGEAPATAIPVASREDAERRARKARCACGARLDLAELDLVDIVLGERTITAVRATCGACGETRRTFFDARGFS
jgi:hypothetical protein